MPLRKILLSRSFLLHSGAKNSYEHTYTHIRCVRALTLRMAKNKEQAWTFQMNVTSFGW